MTRCRLAGTDSRVHGAGTADTSGGSDAASRSPALDGSRLRGRAAPCRRRGAVLSPRRGLLWRWPGVGRAMTVQARAGLLEAAPTVGDLTDTPEALTGVRDCGCGDGARVIGVNVGKPALSEGWQSGGVFVSSAKPGLVGVASTGVARTPDELEPSATIRRFLPVPDRRPARTTERLAAGCFHRANTALMLAADARRGVQAGGIPVSTTSSCSGSGPDGGGRLGVSAAVSVGVSFRVGLEPDPDTDPVVFCRCRTTPL